MTKNEFFTKALPKLLWLNNTFSLDDKEYKQNEKQFFDAETWFAKHYPKDLKELISWMDNLLATKQIQDWCWMLFTSYIESKTCGSCGSLHLIWDNRKQQYSCQDCEV